MSAVLGALLAVIVVIGPPDPNTGSEGGAGAAAPSPSGCTKQVADPASLSAALSSAAPGNKICLTADMPNTRLTINRGGTADAPIQVVGNTRTTTKGITVQASNVIVNGIRAANPQAPGITLRGNNITLENSSSLSPRGGDGDGLRFFGDNVTIRHNTFSDTRNLNGAHADCMQTFATGSDSPASHHVIIDGNRCEKIANQCLIAEGPHSSAGDGSGQGQTSDITFTNNFCQVGASQALEIDDVQNVKVTHNDIAAAHGKAFSFQNKATGALVAANQLGAGVGFEVGMDASSRPGYQGPAIGGNP